MADVVGRYWVALNWDFQSLLGVDVFDYFRSPCGCPQCLSRFGVRGGRSWDQFVMFYESLLNWRGSYVQAMYLSDPEVVDAQASGPEPDVAGQKPSLWGWTKELDALYFVADQVQAGRVRDADSFRPFPRPVIPGEVERKRRKASRVSGGIEAALARGRDAAKRMFS